MLNKVTRINVDGREILLVGTAHVSEDSVKLVKETIDVEKPDAVAVELCGQRYHALEKQNMWADTEITEVIKTGKTHLFLAQLLLANFQRRIGEDFGVKPGAEMVQAINLAKERSIPFFLVDRDINVTFKRALKVMSFYEKSYMLSELFWGFLSGEEIDKELLERLKEKDIMTELIEELSREIPSAKKILIDERDAYIADKIASIKAGKIVAVLGAGHIQGVERLLKENAEEGGKSREEELKELEAVPESKSRAKYVGYAIMGFFFLLLAWGFYSRGGEMALNMFTRWAILHSLFSGLGVLIALGHPLTILTAVAAAPFTPFHPAVSVGMLAALVEAKLRKPRVKDFNELLKLNSIGDCFRNRVTRILLVFFLADLGNNVGNILSLPWIARLL